MLHRTLCTLHRQSLSGMLRTTPTLLSRSVGHDGARVPMTDATGQTQQTHHHIHHKRSHSHMRTQRGKKSGGGVIRSFRHHRAAPTTVATRNNRAPPPSLPPSPSLSPSLRRALHRRIKQKLIHAKLDKLLGAAATTTVTPPPPNDVVAEVSPASYLRKDSIKNKRLNNAVEDVAGIGKEVAAIVEKGRETEIEVVTTSRSGQEDADTDADDIKGRKGEAIGHRHSSVTVEQSDPASVNHSRTTSSESGEGGSAYSAAPISLSTSLCIKLFENNVVGGRERNKRRSVPSQSSSSLSSSSQGYSPYVHSYGGYYNTDFSDIDELNHLHREAVSPPLNPSSANPATHRYHTPPEVKRALRTGLSRLRSHLLVGPESDATSVACCRIVVGGSGGDVPTTSSSASSGSDESHSSPPPHQAPPPPPLQVLLQPLGRAVDTARDHFLRTQESLEEGASLPGSEHYQQDKEGDGGGSHDGDYGADQQMRHAAMMVRELRHGNDRIRASIKQRWAVQYHDSSRTAGIKQTTGGKGKRKTNTRFWHQQVDEKELKMNKSTTTLVSHEGRTHTKVCTAAATEAHYSDLQYLTDELKLLSYISEQYRNQPAAALLPARVVSSSDSDKLNEKYQVVDLLSLDECDSRLYDSIDAGGAQAHSDDGDSRPDDTTKLDESNMAYYGPPPKSNTRKITKCEDIYKVTEREPLRQSEGIGNDANGTNHDEEEKSRQDEDERARTYGRLQKQDGGRQLSVPEIDYLSAVRAANEAEIKWHQETIRLVERLRLFTLMLISHPALASSSSLSVALSPSSLSKVMAPSSKQRQPGTAKGKNRRLQKPSLHAGKKGKVLANRRLYNKKRDELLELCNQTDVTFLEYERRKRRAAELGAHIVAVSATERAVTSLLVASMIRTSAVDHTLPSIDSH